MTDPGHWARCFGFDWHSDIPLEQFDCCAGPSGAEPILVRRIDAFAPLVNARKIVRATIHPSGFRFAWNDEVEFDLSNGRCLRWRAGPQWAGQMPASFYSTVAAMTLASQGMVPLHASAVVMNGAAWLVTGRSGAGKSTLITELLADGGSLLADDLTLLRPTQAGLMAVRGRPGVRLHADSANLLSQADIYPIADDDRGKVLAVHSQRAEDRDWPIGGIIFLGRGEAVDRQRAAAAIGTMLFRPRIMAKLGDNVGRLKALMALAAAVPVHTMIAVHAFDAASRAARIAEFRRFAGQGAPS